MIGTRKAVAAGAALALVLAAPVAGAVWTGDDAPLYQTVDEDMNPVDMDALVADKPLVVIVGSAS